jgi:hypothetical protein
LLPTPQAIDGHPKRSVSPEAAARRLSKGKQAGLPEVFALLPERVKNELMATPNSRDWKGSPGKGSRERGGHQASLPADVGKLTGETMPQPSPDGQMLWDGQPPHQQSLDELDPGFLPSSLNG